MAMLARTRPPRYSLMRSGRREHVQEVPRPHVLEKDSGHAVHDPVEKSHSNTAPSRAGMKLNPVDDTEFR